MLIHPLLDRRPFIEALLLDFVSAEVDIIVGENVVDEFESVYNHIVSEVEGRVELPFIVMITFKYYFFELG